MFALHRHPANIAVHEDRKLGDRLADGVANSMGTWTFILGQAAFTMAWIVLNSSHGWIHAWDSYPYVLLNLVYSFQAGFTGPILLLSQNRQSRHDRLRAEHDYAVDERTNELVHLIAQHHGLIPADSTPELPLPAAKSQQEL
ncbi:DUF1003 domain-containing protein [Kitasatospora viridis]|uniref:Uncharacterized protein DUF1003 n=1 Tax=Kitasatospora viridis TaxID=281105 RepID=A0A561SA22_9ACTN|nr:DUF1003 domain-containing protein [Kitasatospora viridis]TWF71654.1 uncharacterized protein DUF1003 [Kitasatospora viridis]